MSKAVQKVIERPILMCGEMVRATLEDRKTQTRRVIKPQPPYGCVYAINGNHDKACCYKDGPVNDKTVWVPPTPTSDDHLLPCPYGKPRDRLWVRETHHLVTKYLDKDLQSEKRQYVVFKDGAQMYQDGYYYPGSGNYAPGAFDGLKWRPSIFMPRWASRITLEIKNIRVERLQDISPEDMAAEGFRAYVPEASPRLHEIARENFAEGWDSINGKRKGCAWNDNPFVWVIEFQRI